MKKINRITANQDFAAAIKGGKTISNKSFIVHFCNNKLDFTRVGISVSKKLGHSVTRNRIKRQIRAMCDSSITYASHTFDIVIVAKKDFLNCDFNENLDLLNYCLGKIGMKNEKNS